MKKILAFLLVAFLIPATSFAESQTQSDDDTPFEEEILLLWDIPFGIDMEETIARVEEATGIVMTPESSEDGVLRSASAVPISAFSSMRIAGYDADKISALFYAPDVTGDENGNPRVVYPEAQIESLNQIIITWNSKYKVDLDYGVRQFSGILYDLEQKYGGASGCYLAVLIPESGYQHFQIDKRYGYIDTVDFKEAFSNERYVALVAYFSSAIISFDGFTTSIQLAFRDQFTDLPILLPDAPTYAEYRVKQEKGIGF